MRLERQVVDLGPSLPRDWTVVSVFEHQWVVRVVELSFVLGVAIPPVVLSVFVVHPDHLRLFYSEHFEIGDSFSWKLKTLP